MLGLGAEVLWLSLAGAALVLLLVDWSGEEDVGAPVAGLLLVASAFEESVPGMEELEGIEGVEGVESAAGGVAGAGGGVLSVVGFAGGAALVSSVLLLQPTIAKVVPSTTRQRRFDFMVVNPVLSFKT